MTKKDLIDTIKTNKGNLAYVAETGKINGSLLVEIERIMDEWKALNIDSVSVPKGTLPFEFIEWYSGMHTDKIKNAYNRWQKEKGNAL